MPPCVFRPKTDSDPMTRPQKNTLLGCGIAAALLSIPLPWMTISQPQGSFFNGDGSPMTAGDPLFEAMSEMTPSMTVDVTGLSGYVTLLFKVPLWLVALTAAAACGVPLLANTAAFAVPRWLPWAFAVPAGVWVGASLLLGLTSGRTIPGVGVLLAAAAVASAVVNLLLPTADSGGNATPPARADLAING